MAQELRGDHGADRVAAEVLGAGAAAAVSEEPGHRIRAARFELAPQDVQFTHRCSMRQRAPPTEDLARGQVFSIQQVTPPRPNFGEWAGSAKRSLLAADAGSRLSQKSGSTTRQPGSPVSSAVPSRYCSAYQRPTQSGG